MAEKKSPEIMRLEAWNYNLQRQLDRIRETPPDCPVAPCQSTTCIITRPKGEMGHAGPCKCHEDPRKMLRLVQYQRLFIEHQRLIIALARDSE